MIIYTVVSIYTYGIGDKGFDIYDEDVKVATFSNKQQAEEYRGNQKKELCYAIVTVYETEVV